MYGEDGLNGAHSDTQQPFAPFGHFPSSLFFDILFADEHIPNGWRKNEV